MSSQEMPSKMKRFLADTPVAIGFALPYIIGGGVLGAVLGSALGSTANGFRVGVILGGAVAFWRILRKAKRHS
jgi:hypothetical protein